MGKKGKEVHKCLTLFRILELLLAHGEMRAGRLSERLAEEGFLNGAATDKTTRRLLNYYLRQLEEWGFVERVGNGRSVAWRLRKPLVRDNCYLTAEQKVVLTLLLLATDEFVKETFADELGDLLKKLSFAEHLKDALSSDLNLRYLYGADFKRLLPLAKKIFGAIEQKRFISLLYMGERVYTKILPIGFAVRNGRLYLVALEERGEKRYFSLERISNLSLLNKTYPGRKYPPAGRFALFGDKPFVFGMRIKAKLYLSEEFLKFHPLVFHHEGTEGDYTLYMVGFDSDYFASRFAVFVFNEFIPPDGEMLRLADARGLKLLFPDLELDGAVQSRRYRSFLERLRSALEKRLRRVERALGN